MSPVLPVVVNLSAVNNQTLQGSIHITLNNSLWEYISSLHRKAILANITAHQNQLQQTEEPPYDQSGAGLYACLVIAFYAFSIMMFIATIVKRKVGDE